jgi:hypothetical protein
MAQGDDVFPIPGTKHISYLEENLRAVELVLDDEEIQAVRDVAENVEVAGDRYDPRYVLAFLPHLFSLFQHYFVVTQARELLSSSVPFINILLLEQTRMVSGHGVKQSDSNKTFISMLATLLIDTPPL